MLDPLKKISIKIAKKFKIIINLFPALFLAEKGWDKPRKGEKNFRPQFHSYWSPARKFREKQQKN